MIMQRNDLYRAIGRSMLGRYAVYATNLVSLSVLARIFAPQDFGTVAAIAVFVVFFQLMAEAGLGPAIINLNQLSHEDRNGLFTLTVLVGFGLSAIFLALAPVFLAFYELPRVDEVVPFVALSLLFYAGSIVPNAFLLRGQAFFRIAHAGLAGEIVSTVTAVVLSMIIDPLHALASKAAVSAGISFAVIFAAAAKTEFGRPALGTRISAIKPLLGFSSYQFGFNFINYFSRNLDNILVGKYLGAASLGIYDKAYQLMRYPLMLLTFAMTPAIQPVIRQYAGDAKKVEAIHRDFTFKLSLIGGAAGLTMYILADPIVRVLLGNQWEEVIPLIRILAIAVPVQVVLSTSGSFFQAMNRADLLFLSGSLSACVMVAAIVWGILRRDILVLSWGLVVAFHISFFQAHYILYRKVFKESLGPFLLRMIPAGGLVVALSVSY